ncbi:MAG TPA: hypothetical protein VGI17_06330 [Solirubrobacterales bacterium]
MIKQSLRLSMALCVLIALAALNAGCGGSGSSQTATEAGSTAKAASGAEPSSAFPKNELVEFGHEASASEREAASKVLNKNLKAREDADFATQCATLSQSSIESVAVGKKGAAAVKACPTALKVLGTPLSRTKPFRIDTLDGEIAVLRVKGKEAQALYHGNDGHDYSMPLTKEHGHWTVGAILTTELTPSEKGKPSSGAQANK